VVLQQGGLLNNIKLKALAPDEVDALKARYRLPQSDVDWIVKHDFR
jgi:hypothetical protein